MKNVLRLLVSFERAPKEINGRQITAWFNIAESLFEEFHNLGVKSAWNYSQVKQASEAEEILQLITRNKNDLQIFITIYPNLRIDLDGSHSPASICKVRSGLQFLLQGFKGINSSFNKVLADLKEFGELEEFDHQLRVWVESGHRPDFFTEDKHPNIPTNHWWWF